MMNLKITRPVELDTDEDVCKGTSFTAFDMNSPKLELDDLNLFIYPNPSMKWKHFQEADRTRLQRSCNHHHVECNDATRFVEVGYWRKGPYDCISSWVEQTDPHFSFRDGFFIPFGNGGGFRIPPGQICGYIPYEILRGASHSDYFNWTVFCEGYYANQFMQYDPKTATMAYREARLFVKKKPFVPCTLYMNLKLNQAESPFNIHIDTQTVDGVLDFVTTFETIVCADSLSEEEKKNARP